MKAWLSALDRILRGETTNVGGLKEGLREIPLGGMTVLIICLGAIYGLGMGSFALSKTGGPSFAQFLASAVKVPMLFLLTLVVTFPSLYVFNALLGSRLDLLSVLRLLVAGLAVTLAVLASFGPIVAFFSVSTTSYSFMVLLNVAMCAAAGVLGLTFLRQTLHRITLARTATPPPIPPQPASGALSPSALDEVAGQPLGKHVKGVFRCWMVLFALVGSQMAWVLRPFIGQPDVPFTFFRERHANFFIGVWEHLVNLFR
ncbi:hypothetical protein ACXR0O_13640 [Verrucomicrobiota bacterium sgz303538]